MHLKRKYTPASWLVEKKTNKYIVKPSPGPHAMEKSLPLNLVLKSLGLAKTSRSVRKILQGEVLIDGKRRRDPRFAVGVMDVISFPALKKHYRLILDEKGRLKTKEIEEKESKIKINKVINKTAVKKGQNQINLDSGNNILTENKIQTGNSLVLELPGNKIKQVLELKKGAYIFILKGKYAGSHGALLEIKDNKIIFQTDRDKIETLKKYALVIGEKEPLIKLKDEK